MTIAVLVHSSCQAVGICSSCLYVHTEIVMDDVNLPEKRNDRQYAGYRVSRLVIGACLCSYMANTKSKFPRSVTMTIRTSSACRFTANFPAKLPIMQPGGVVHGAILLHMIYLYLSLFCSVSALLSAKEVVVMRIRRNK